MSVKKRTPPTIATTNGKVFHLTPTAMFCEYNEPINFRDERTRYKAKRADVAKALRSRARTVALSGLWYGVGRLYREHWNVIHDDSHTCVAIGCMEFGAAAAKVLKKWARDGRGV